MDKYRDDSKESLIEKVEGLESLVEVLRQEKNKEELLALECTNK